MTAQFAMIAGLIATITGIAGAQRPDGQPRAIWLLATGVAIMTVTLSWAA